MSTNKKTVVPENLNLMEINALGNDFRPAKRDLGISHRLSLILGAVMICTAPEFRGGNDPRPAAISDETVQYMRKVLERSGVDVDGSIDRALNRNGATA